jgi:MFS family permease
LLGILISLVIVWQSQGSSVGLTESTFRVVVLLSLLPAVLAVLSLALGAEDVAVTEQRDPPKFGFRGLGRPFLILMLIVGLFDLGNSSDAFLVLRAQERGLGVLGVLAMVAVFNLVYSLVSTPAGALSDRIGRRSLLIGGWLLYALIYLGFALADRPWHVWILYAVYGLYYGLTYGTAKALVADVVPERLRGTAFGTYNAVLGLLDFPASLIAGLLWDGWSGIGFAGFGPSAPFFFGATMAGLAALAMALWRPDARLAAAAK